MDVHALQWEHNQLIRPPNGSMPHNHESGTLATLLQAMTLSPHPLAFTNTLKEVNGNPFQTTILFSKYCRCQLYGSTQRTYILYISWWLSFKHNHIQNTSLGPQPKENPPSHIMTLKQRAHHTLNTNNTLHAHYTNICTCHIYECYAFTRWPIHSANRATSRVVQGVK